MNEHTGAAAARIHADSGLLHELIETVRLNTDETRQLRESFVNNTRTLAKMEERFGAFFGDEDHKEPEWPSIKRTVAFHHTMITRWIAVLTALPVVGGFILWLQSFSKATK